jgi:DNA polymerase II small subunit/DNA polymerase delta subunit B
MSNQDLSEFHRLTEVEELRRVITSLQRQLRSAKTRDVNLTTAAREGAREAFTALGVPPKVPVARKQEGTEKPEVAVLHLSDWQVGKKTASYDSDVAEARIQQLSKKFEHMVQIERADHPVNECWLLYGGDHVEGVNIFPGQQYEIDSTLFEQHARASRMLVNLTRHACAGFEKVHVVTEDGNHGRIGQC